MPEDHGISIHEAAGLSLFDVLHAAGSPLELAAILVWFPLHSVSDDLSHHRGKLEPMAIETYKKKERRKKKEEDQTEEEWMVR